MDEAKRMPMAAFAAATLAGSLAVASAAKAGPAPAQPGADTTCAGASTVDYDPAHCKNVAKASCVSMAAPKGHDMLQPM